MKALPAAQPAVPIRLANASDLAALVELEKSSFEFDRLSKRSLRHWLKAEHAIFVVAEHDGGIVGYGLVWCHRGTRHARLYSLAVAASMRGQGLGKSLLLELERRSSERGYLFMRLEVGKENHAAIRVYRELGYKKFGEYYDYYGDHSDALRMQKTIRYEGREHILRITPWYRQSTPFTCGPAALMMAMSSVSETVEPSQSLELSIWRTATTIFMTSGHGGCHPFGLALAAARMGFHVHVFVNTDKPLFLDGVRTQSKKDVMTLVHDEFLKELQQQPYIDITYQEFSLSQISYWLEFGYAVIALISTYRLDGKKAPHWVCITSMDERCLYVHDPDPGDQGQEALDCQHMPIAHEDFSPMSSFGTGRLRTAIAIRKN